MRFIALFFGIVLPSIAAGCLGGGPRMKEIELTEAQKLFKTKTTFEDGVIAVEVRRQDGTMKTLNRVLNYESTFASFLPRPPPARLFDSRMAPLG